MLLLSVLATSPAFAAQEILVEFGSPMTYLANGVDPGIGLSWTAEAFDESSWSSGTYGVGYESASGAESLIQTSVAASTRSIYTRTTFELQDASAIVELTLGVDYDDGYAAWINGQQRSGSRLFSVAGHLAGGDSGPA
jgi:hypothetical protein